MYIKVVRNLYLGHEGESSSVPVSNEQVKKTSGKGVLQSIMQFLEGIKNDSSLWEMVQNAIKYANKEYGYNISIPLEPTQKNIERLKTTISSLLKTGVREQPTQTDITKYLPWILIAVAVVILIFVFK